MEAELLLDRRDVLSETAFIERVLWLLPQPLWAVGIGSNIDWLW